MIKDAGDSIRELGELIASEDQLLQILRANRSELDRMELQQKQADNEESTIGKELAMLFDDYKSVLGCLQHLPLTVHRFYNSL